MTILLSLQGVSKRFGGLQALLNVTFDLPQGQIVIGDHRSRSMLSGA